MGLGGHLLWTSVIRSLHEASGKPVRLVQRPKASDLLSGRLYDGEVSLATDQVFSRNPRAEFPALVRKSAAVRGFDRIAEAVIRRTGLSASFERLVMKLAQRRARRTGQYDAHIDLAIHSYVAREQPDRMVWKKGGHIIDIILNNFDCAAVDHRCEMYFSAAEEEEARAIRAAHGLHRYVVIEPNSNEAWFGDLRAWPFERWQQVVDAILADGRYDVVQIGEAGRPVLAGVINLAGSITFRTAVLLMKSARLFLGIEGGLMHAANAAGVPAVIVWGGLTLPEFAGYPEWHSIVCKHVECAPCGLRGNCPYGKKCLLTIETDEMVAMVRQRLEVGS